MFRKLGFIGNRTNYSAVKKIKQWAKYVKLIILKKPCLFVVFLVQFIWTKKDYYTVEGVAGIMHCTEERLPHKVFY
jgi:hypothetical protein